MKLRHLLWLILCSALAACASNTAPSPGPTVQPATPSLSSAIVLRPAPADLGCDSIGVEYQSVTFHIDPAATEPVGAVTDTGVSLVTHWAAGFRAGTAAERVVRDPAGQVVVADGDVLKVGQRLHGYFVCLSHSALYVLLTDPS